MIFVNCLNTADFSTNFRDCCRVRIEDFPTNQDFEHGFEHCIEVICFSNCSFFVISTCSDDFWLENRDPNRSEAKKQRFSSIVLIQQNFQRNFVVFVGSASIPHAHVKPLIPIATARELAGAVRLAYVSYRCST